MKFSRTVGYAVRATIHLARSDSPSPIPCSQLASEGNMPERFLLQILRNLVMHGILKSSRGVDGGYTLTKSPEQITLLEIIEAIEGPVGLSPDVGEGFAELTGARLQDALSDAAATYRKQLEAITFAQLIEPPTAAETSRFDPPAEGTLAAPKSSEKDQPVRESAKTASEQTSRNVNSDESTPRDSGSAAPGTTPTSTRANIPAPPDEPSSDS